MEEPQDYFAGAGAGASAEPDYFSGVPPPSSIAGQILRATSDNAQPRSPPDAAERETAGVGGLLERMGGMDLRSGGGGGGGGMAYEESPFASADGTSPDEVPVQSLRMGARTGSESHVRALAPQGQGGGGEGRRASFAQVAGRGL